MRELKINLSDAISVIAEKLEQGGEVMFSPHGTSMLPTLKEGRDTVVLVAPTSRLKKYDLALFRRNNGQYVLHRVIHSGSSYTFMGDNQLWREKNIQHEQIVGVCIAYVRNGKRVELNSFGCRIYARFWHGTRFFRRAYRALQRRIKALLGHH